MSLAQHNKDVPQEKIVEALIKAEIEQEDFEARDNEILREAIKTLATFHND